MGSENMYFMEVILWLEAKKTTAKIFRYYDPVKEIWKSVFHFYEIPERDLSLLDSKKRTEVINNLWDNPPEVNKWAHSSYITNS